MTTHVLTQISTDPIPENPDEVRLFAVVRNEILRLPYFMEFYRKKGVNRFFVVDNASDDGTTQFLLAQKDCHVFQTRNSYRESHCGLDWQNTLLDMYGTGQWCLTVDADELLVWPHSDDADIRTLTQWLDREGSEGLYTFMLDMYPQGSLAQAAYKQGDDFLKTCPLFDKDYQIIPRLHLRPWREPLFPKNEVIGGPRLRLFYRDQMDQGVCERAYRKIFWNLALHLSSMGLINKKNTPHPAPTLFKMPLIKWRKDSAYIASTHLLNCPHKLSAVTGVLLHFKFFSDFHDKAVVELARGEHFGGGFEYKRYLDASMACDKNLDFSYAGSVRYTGAADLIDKKLIKTTPEFDAYMAPPK